jgi:hypothetical protein
MATAESAGENGLGRARALAAAVAACLRVVRVEGEAGAQPLDAEFAGPGGQRGGMAGRLAVPGGYPQSQVVGLLAVAVADEPDLIGPPGRRLVMRKPSRTSSASIRAPLSPEPGNAEDSRPARTLTWTGAWLASRTARTAGESRIACRSGPAGTSHFPACSTASDENTTLRRPASGAHASQLLIGGECRLAGLGPHLVVTTVLQEAAPGGLKIRPSRVVPNLLICGRNRRTRTRGMGWCGSRYQRDRSFCGSPADGGALL